MIIIDLLIVHIEGKHLLELAELLLELMLTFWIQVLVQALRSSHLEKVRTILS